MAKKRRIPVTLEDGKQVMAEVGGDIDLRVPMKDDRTDVVPEFVTVSNKTQVHPIPNDPGEPIVVPMMGVLKGAQWRMLSEKKGGWGKTPPYMERVQGKYVTVVDKEKVGVPFDPKYLLTEEQMLEQIEKLSNRGRIHVLTQNSVFIDPPPDQVTRLGYREVHMGPVMYQNTDMVDARPRRPDDRGDVMTATLNRTYALEQAERKYKESMGVAEA